LNKLLIQITFTKTNNMSTKVVPIGADHAGFILKGKIINFLETQGYEVKDFGCFSEESIDYPDFAHPVAEMVEQNKDMLGILICGSGNGINMTANKHAGIRSALCWEVEIAALARQHNDANIVALPARFISEEVALEIVKTFLGTEFEGGRHQKRVDKITC
jgi:ribose 5-phosphate isomerase B